MTFSLLSPVVHAAISSCLYRSNCFCFFLLFLRKHYFKTIRDRLLQTTALFDFTAALITDKICFVLLARFLYMPLRH